MGLIKCPRCELNYIPDTEKICSVCKREVRGEPEQDDLLEMCSECGEHPALPGQELCMYCLKELQHRSAVVAAADDGIAIAPGDAAIDIDSVSTMDEIALDIPDDDMSDTPFPADDGESFDDEDDEEDDEVDDIEDELDALEDDDDDDDDED